MPPAAPARAGTDGLAVALIVACQSTQALALGGIALFLPLIRADVDLSFAQAGTLASAATLVYALMQVPSGYLADRLGARRLFLVGLLGANAMSLLLAVLDSYPLLLLNQAASGFFRALVFAPGMLLITGHFPPGRRASALGLYVAGGFSSSIALSTAGPLLVDDVGWRPLFVAFSVLGLAAVAAYALLPAGAGPSPSGAPVRLAELGPLLRSRVLRLAGAVQFVRLAVVAGLAFWLPTYLVVDKGFSLREAGLAVALGAALTAPSNILGGYVSDRLGRPLLVIAVSLAVLGVTTALLVPARGAAVVVVIGVNAVFLQVYFGPLFQVPVEVLGERVAGLASGVSNLCANLGGLASAYLLGVSRDVTGSFTTGLLGLAVLCGAGLLATAGLSRLHT